MLSVACWNRAACLNSQGKITPQVITKESLDTPEKLLSPERWDAIYGIPKGEITIERIQHAFYMAANYGFQILNGNFAAAIDDYELKLRFMNDLATYRIDVSWLWTLLQHQAVITKDGYLKRPALTEDGVEPAANADHVKAGTRFTTGAVRQTVELPQRVDTQRSLPSRTVAATRHALIARKPTHHGHLKKQLPSPRYIQHSARVLFVVGQANKQEGDAVAGSHLRSKREEAAKRVQAGSFKPAALAAHDYVFDIFPDVTAGKAAPS